MRRRADWLEEVLKNTGIRVGRWHVQDAWNIEHIRDRVFDLLAERENDAIALNATGGTKPMSIAAYEVFRSMEKPIFYVHPEQDRLIWLHPRELPALDLADRVKLPAFLQAHGAAVIGQGSVLGVKEHLRTVTEGLIRHVDRYAQPMRTLNWAANLAEQNKSLKSPVIPRAQQTEGFQNLIGWFETANLLHRDGEQILFADEEARFFANGGWLETHVYAQCLALKKMGVQDVGRSLLVERQGKSGPVRNELDVAFLYQNRLYVIECKTKHYDRHGNDPGGADTLYKLDTLRDVLGGLQARAMLVSYHSLNDADCRRADDLRIRLCVGSQLQQLGTELQQWIQ